MLHLLSGLCNHIDREKNRPTSRNSLSQPNCVDYGSNSNTASGQMDTGVMSANHLHLIHFICIPCLTYIYKMEKENFHDLQMSRHISIINLVHTYYTLYPINLYNFSWNQCEQLNVSLSLISKTRPQASLIFTQKG